MVEKNEEPEAATHAITATTVEATLPNGGASNTEKLSVANGSTVNGTASSNGDGADDHDGNVAKEVAGSGAPSSLTTVGDGSSSMGIKERLLAQKFSDDSSELSELDDSEAETERLDLDELGHPEIPISSNNTIGRKRRLSQDSEDVIVDENDDISSASKRTKLENDAAQNANEDGDTSAETGNGDPETEEIDGKDIIEHGNPMVVAPDVIGDADGEQEVEVDGDAEGEEDEGEEEEDEDEDEEREDLAGKGDNEASSTKLRKGPVVDVESDNGTAGASDVVDDETAQLEALEQARRQKAISFLTEIEIDFAKLRDQLHDDKMRRYTAEIEMCADGTHPELESVYSRIEERREEKLRLAKKHLEYKQKCIAIQTRAGREQAHQQFMKEVADSRASLLLRTTEEWYRVNRERRAMDTLVQDYTFRPPESHSSQLRELSSLNYEISLLTGISKYIGFPAAPEIKPLSDDELDADLSALGLR